MRRVQGLVMFARGDTSITIPAPWQSYMDSERAELRFDLPATAKAALAAFYKDTALGTKEECIYTDSIGVGHRVRFVESAIVFVKSDNSFWSVDVLLTREGEKGD